MQYGKCPNHSLPTLPQKIEFYRLSYQIARYLARWEHYCVISLQSRMANDFNWNRDPKKDFYRWVECSNFCFIYFLTEACISHNVGITVMVMNSSLWNCAILTHPCYHITGRSPWASPVSVGLQDSFTSLKTPEDQWFHLRFICPIHPYSAATIQAASYDETIVIQALGTLCLYTMHSN